MTIDYMTATPREVIARSIAMHPSLYADAMRDAAKTHRHYAASVHRADVASIAKRLALACELAADKIEADDVEAILFIGADCWISALNVACKLQCVPPSLRGDIAARA